MGAQGVLHALCVQRDGARAERGLQLVHVLKRRIDRLRRAAQLFCDAAGVDSRKSALPQHLHRRIHDRIPRDPPDSRHRILLDL